MPAALTIRRTFDRAPAEVVRHLGAIPTGWLVDANGKRGALDARIRPVSRVTDFCGTAYTVRSRPRDNLAAYAALEHAAAGDVLIIATEDYCESSVVGDVFIGLARNRGVLAIVTDGMVRDVAGINAVGIPVFARGLHPNSPHKDGPGELGTAVCMGGLTIQSGDVIRGDADGVVVVARSAAQTVVQALEEVRRKETAMDQWVREGLQTPPWLKDTVASAGVRYLD